MEKNTNKTLFIYNRAHSIAKLNFEFFEVLWKEFVKCVWTKKIVDVCPFFASLYYFSYYKKSHP